MLSQHSHQIPFRSYKTSNVAYINPSSPFISPKVLVTPRKIWFGVYFGNQNYARIPAYLFHNAFMHNSAFNYDNGSTRQSSKKRWYISLKYERRHKGIRVISFTDAANFSQALFALVLVWWKCIKRMRVYDDYNDTWTQKSSALSISLEKVCPKFNLCDKVLNSTIWIISNHLNLCINIVWVNMVALDMFCEAPIIHNK